MNFKQYFFRLYDRKIASGEVTFSQTGINKNEFTKLCTEEGFVFNDETIDKIIITMKLTDEEAHELKRLAGEENNNSKN